MKSFGESALRNFSMDGPSSIYEFEGENYKDKEKVGLHIVSCALMVTKEGYDDTKERTKLIVHI